jgi:hypothetical protein
MARFRWVHCGRNLCGMAAPGVLQRTNRTILLLASLGAAPICRPNFLRNLSMARYDGELAKQFSLLFFITRDLNYCAAGNGDHCNSFILSDREAFSEIEGTV